MTRSYKKNPIVKDSGKSKKAAKKFANSSLRMQQKQGIEVADGGSFKKHTDSWSITDYVSRYTKQEAIDDYNNPNTHIDKKAYPTLESWIKEMEKYYKRK